MTDRTFTIVIPTYNRAQLVDQAIRSAVAWISGALDCEIVVVDDCSTDNTLSVLERNFANEIKADFVRVIPLGKNVGVVKAKNRGAQAANGKWIVFLDSDDEMVADSAVAIREACAGAHRSPLVFFRSQDLQTGELLGIGQEGILEVGLKQYISGIAFGECLPVVRNDAAKRFPFDERLTGWEGLAYGRMLRAIGPLVVSPVVARRYRTSGDDRLSSEVGIKRRARSLMYGHWLLLYEFARYFTPIGLTRQVGKIAYYLLRCVTRF